MNFGRVFSWFLSSYLVLIANYVWLGKTLRLSLREIELGADQAQRQKHLFLLREFVRRQCRLSYRCARSLILSHEVTRRFAMTLLNVRACCVFNDGEWRRVVVWRDLRLRRSSFLISLRITRCCDCRDGTVSIKIDPKT